MASPRYSAPVLDYSKQLQKRFSKNDEIPQVHIGSDQSCFDNLPIYIIDFPKERARSECPFLKYLLCQKIPFGSQGKPDFVKKLFIPKDKYDSLMEAFPCLVIKVSMHYQYSNMSFSCVRYGIEFISSGSLSDFVQAFEIIGCKTPESSHCLLISAAEYIRLNQKMGLTWLQNKLKLSTQQPYETQENFSPVFKRSHN